MRFAFKTANHYTSWGEVLDVWKEADRIEVFESGWLFDHFYPIASARSSEPDPSQPCLEGWSMLAALAQATSRLRLGTLVTGIHYRHPAVLANMAATIDIISGGRLEIGIGAGWNEQESGAYGIRLGGPRERSDRFEEACQVLIGLLSQPTTNFQGTYYQLTAARCEPKPIQRPHPPLTIGGSGEKRTLRTVARYAQHWNFVGGTPEEFARKRDVLHGHCRDVGRDPAEITLSAHVWLHSAQEIGRTVDEVAALAEVGLDMAIIYLLPPLTPAVLTPLAEALTPLR
ncbi:LLM class F420-dependent oxidoreductase [Saccharopolyspora sp. 5N708]|uniref:LLM class F420-dependent oxidoreductase n=1 Tax=Saccharopolyspora sp. 5N708 TaxID=3457424 RepID=UPI003FD41E64